MKFSDLTLRIQAVVAAFGLLFFLPAQNSSVKTGNNSTALVKSPERTSEKMKIEEMIVK